MEERVERWMQGTSHRGRDALHEANGPHLAAVIIPLTTPQAFVPVDPTNPMPEPNAEQTASPLSHIIFSFLDPVIWIPYKLPHLPYDLLPPLADTNYSENPKKRGFPNVDVFSGAGMHHIFFGIIKTFRHETAAIIAMLLMYAAHVCPMHIRVADRHQSSPSAPRRRPGDSSIRPFVWILWLVLGPLAGTAAMQAYYRLSMRIFVQIEGLLTELIFEHALPVRVKGHNAEAAPGAADGTPSPSDAQADANSETAQGTPSTTSKDPKHLVGTSASARSSADVGMIPLQYLSQFTLFWGPYFPSGERVKMYKPWAFGIYIIVCAQIFPRV
ncbi:hypothetical protein FB451DRAFT_360344 [Mycena latifolia]|nr:hypothetical protein FB451DRAFT_157812 [Mycena latifolia]KAJ7494879.1 hypothetical protein FB451DRAFT_360344 [Mycena latifolia]